METSGGKLGGLGALGFFVAWAIGSYLFLAVMGYGFITELPMLFSPLSKVNQLIYLQRFYSRLDDERGVLRTTQRAWRMTLSNMKDGVIPDLHLQTSQGVLKVPVRAFQQFLEEARIPLDKPSNQIPAWKRQARAGVEWAVLPDFYGFPLVPIGSEDLLARHFPDLRDARSLRVLFDVSIDPATSVKSRLQEVGTIDSFFTYPLIWRAQKFVEKVQRKRSGALIWVVVQVIGAFVTLWLLTRPVPPLYAEPLRFLAGAFGVAAIFGFLFRFYATCYMAARISDDQTIDGATLELIRTDCQKYVDDLQQEQRISPEDRKILSELLRRG